MYQERSGSSKSGQRIIEQAAQVLAEGHGRTMQEIADISGIGRATLYRYFRTREDLILAIKYQALDEAREAMNMCCVEEGTADEALRRVIAAFISVGSRYRIIFEDGTFKENMSAEAENHAAEMLALIERGQREGTFNSAMPATWILGAMFHLVIAGIKQIQQGDLARNHAPDIVADTLLQGIRPPKRGQDS